MGLIRSLENGLAKAVNCQEANGSAWRWRELSSVTLQSLFWTSRRPLSTHKPKKRYLNR